MKVLLVTLTEQLAEKLGALNPELEYCAAVVDNVESTKEILAGVGLSQVPVYPMEELKTCAETLKYDYLFCLQKHMYDGKIMIELSKYNLPKDKVLGFALVPFALNLGVEQSLRYCKEHSQDFEIFATGISHAAHGLDIRQFKRSAINLAKPSQDLYYDYNVAKSLVLCEGGHSKLRYALIGLTPYSFHYDLSLIFRYRCLFLQYLIAFNDLHNFSVPVEVYKQFIREKYFTYRLPVDKFDVNNPYHVPINERTMKAQDTKESSVCKWNKNYPKTRDENIKILDEYLTFCEENNIRPIMFVVPVTERYMANFNPKLLEDFHTLIEAALKKHPSSRFVDGWKLNLGTHDNFFDPEHMNVHGAAKFSSYLNDFIEKLEAQGG